MPIRFLLGSAVLFVLCHQAARCPHAAADGPRLHAQVTLATYRLEHPNTSGTAFVVNRHGPAGEEDRQLLLVTAAHAFEKMSGDQPTLVLRQQDTNGSWSPSPIELTIRQGDQPLWHKHPQHDVAVMRLPRSVPPETASIPLHLLANAEDWQTIQPEPGMLVRCVGFPHAAQFKPSAAGFPLTRLGCLASYPLVPFEQFPTFMIDYNTFEGDSGGPVYVEASDGDEAGMTILGLVFGQHFIDERYELVYQKGLIRKRLGLAVVVNSQAILEAVETLP